MRVVRDNREVLYDANEHTALVASILAESHLKPYNIFRHMNISGKRIIDIGCGDGTISRTCIQKGASYVLGIDGMPDMIKIARQLTPANIGIDFQIAYIEDIDGNALFDYAILSYLLNNARNFEQLSQQLQKTASFLKKGGIAVVYNSNPFDVTGGDFSKYGFRKSLTGILEGDPIVYDYRPAITENIINYYISPQRHEQAFRDAGFSEFIWAPLELWPDADKEFWHEYFDREHLPVISMIAKK